MNVGPNPPKPFVLIAIFCGFFFLVVALQKLSGAYTSEFGGYPDEPAHYVTSVMVHDFLLSGKWDEPLLFARRYYEHYPKVAFGHWPPLLYVIQGIWMVLFSVSRTSVLLELALTTTVAAFLLFLVASRAFGWRAGLLGAILLICLPIIQIYSDEEMAESLLLIMTFQAAIFFARYLERKRWQDNFWFAIFCSLAILTKGNGWALAIIVPIAIALTRDWAILKRPSFWISVPVVLVLCVPWQFLTLDLAQRGWTGGSKPSMQYTVQALWEFAGVTRDLLGWALTALALVGIWSRVAAPFRTKTVQPLFASLFGLIISMWVFHSVVPAGVEGRKMVNALPAIILFALAGGQTAGEIVSQKLSGGKLRLPWAHGIIAFASILLFAAETFQVPKEEHFGYTELSSYIESRPELRNSVILVSSERDGEGLFVSELMMQDQRPSHTILRATKTLSESDWTGQVSKETYNSPGEVMEFLKQQQVTAVVLDTFPRRTHYQHNDLILAAIRDYPGAWRLQSTFSDGRIQLYEFKKS